MSTRARRLVQSAVLCAGTLLFMWLFLRFLLKPAAPFIAAFIVSRTLEAPAASLRSHLKFPPRIAALVCTAGFLIAIFLIAKAVLTQGFSGMQEILSAFPSSAAVAENLTAALTGMSERLFGHYTPLIVQAAKHLMQSGASIPLRLYEKLAAVGAYAAGLIPNTFLFIITFSLACYFFLCDYTSIRAYAAGRLPPKLLSTLANVRKNLLCTAVRYLKAVGILALITFFMLACGLMLLRTNHSIATAFFIALLDALPIFGCGFALIPWALFSLICGQGRRAIGLSALYLAITLVRNMLEARIVGTQTGLHPLVSLAAAYAGVHFFGMYGLFLPPVIAFLRESLRPHMNVRPQ